MSFAEHARSLFSFNEWANNRIIDAAARCNASQIAELQRPLAHTIGTQVFWHAIWTGAGAQEGDRRARTGPLAASSMDQLWSAYAMSHDELRAYAMTIEDADWHRAKKWWAPYTDDELPLGDTIVQVVNHGTQHRSEVAVDLTRFGQSPGDLDYLNFALEMHGGRRQ